MSSATARLGCVSFIWMAALSGSSSRSSCCWRKRRMMSPMAQATRKYSCTRRSSLPATAASDGYKDARDVFAGDLLLDGVDVVAAVEDLDVEVFGSARGEQAQPVHGLAEIADDGHVGGNAEHNLVVDPSLLEVAVGVALRVHAAVHRDADRLFGMLDLEGSAVGLPAIRFLALEAADDFLLEQSELVVDAVTIAGHAECGERFEEARSQATEAAVAETGIGLAVENFVEIRRRGRRVHRGTVPRCASWRRYRPRNGP